MPKKLSDYTLSALELSLSQQEFDVGGVDEEIIVRRSDNEYIADYKCIEHSYGVTQVSYTRAMRPEAHIMLGIMTLGLSLPFTAATDIAMRAGLGKHTYYFDTKTEDMLGDDQNKAAERADDIGIALMREKRYDEACTYFNMAYHLCTRGYRNESDFKRRKSNAQKCAEEEKEREERESREREEREARERSERQARERTEREARERTEREARERAEREARERAEREARERAEREARERAEREARERAEREARERAEREARERAEREAREIAKREAQEMAQIYVKGLTKRPPWTKREARERIERQPTARAENETRDDAEKSFKEALQCWEDGFVAEAQNNLLEAKLKFERSHNLFCQVLSLNRNNRQYENWVNISALKIQGDDLFNKAVALHEEANKLHQNKKYEEAHQKYCEAKTKYQEGLKKSDDRRFQACIEIVDVCILAIKEDMENTELEVRTQRVQFLGSPKNITSIKGCTDITEQMSDLTLYHRVLDS